MASKGRISGSLRRNKGWFRCRPRRLPSGTLSITLEETGMREEATIRRAGSNFAPAINAHLPSLTAETMDHTYMQWYTNAELEIMANAGHYPADETPVALATLIEDFLRV